MSFRFHPEFGKKRKLPKFDSNDQTSLVDNSENLDVSDDVYMEPESSVQSNENENSEILTFVPYSVQKHEIFIKLFSAIMKSKLLHSIPEQGLNEILMALKVASEKSINIYEKKMKQAILAKYDFMLDLYNISFLIRFTKYLTFFLTI